MPRIHAGSDTGSVGPWRLHRLAAIALILALPSGLAQAQTPGGPPGAEEAGPAEVGVIELLAEDVPYALTLPGRAVAFEEADVRPRVSGVIEEVAFQAGRPVKAGDLLFRIEDDTYATAVAAAEATVAGARSSVATAQATVERYRSLEGSAVTRADLETAEAALSQARASLASSEAALQAAQLDQERSEIRSPIDGIPDVAEVSVGELVTANQAEALTRVTRLDPIYVDVTESSARMLRIRERIDAGTLESGDALGMKLVLETGEMHEGEGTLVTPATAVSTTTGTVDFRVQFDNPDCRVLPGQFLRVEVTLGTSPGIIVPQRATSRAPDGSLTAFVARDGVAYEVTLTTTGTYRNGWVVTEGAQPGDQLIVDGLNNLRDGAEVVPRPVEIDEQGVVRDVASTEPAQDPETTEEGAPSTAQAGPVSGTSSGARSAPAQE
ncbi:efflux RND transporter periplasmic adaptor subunit [Rubellimicrobium rubrum]|uniref:Efflux RND transporter periplasmic adaptor subunit n=1 Tax=Rubellimicrobium rubrum TaxID=2585369 RepID=A0A5C4N1J8_9RHOB|nr:efflux RND transporter periplasmic adaptor subunit [Rubellimicrobium rubrum]TNC51225.1 efflux RND transporter periplasmic adaptor subunit [Rubellimicrobium rubrum]